MFQLLSGVQIETDERLEPNEIAIKHEDGTLQVFAPFTKMVNYRDILPNGTVVLRQFGEVLPDPVKNRAPRKPPPRLIDEKFAPIRLVYGVRERPCAKLKIGMKFKDHPLVIPQSTDGEGWVPVPIESASDIEAILLGDGEKVTLSWPPGDGERLTLNVGPERPKDYRP